MRKNMLVTDFSMRAKNTDKIMNRNDKSKVLRIIRDALLL